MKTLKLLLFVCIISLMSCSKEALVDGCGSGCEVIANTSGDPNCGKVVGGASWSESCDFGYILVVFNGSSFNDETVICLTEENRFNYPIHSIYCNN